MKEEILRFDHVTCVHRERTVLKDINLHIFKGEIIGLLSINYQGIKELLDVLSDNVPIHYGYVYFDEQLVNCYYREGSSRNKVSVIKKQSSLAEDLTVCDNIFALRRGFKKYVINSGMLKKQFRHFVDELGIDLQGDELVKDLSVFDRKLVELIKAVIAGTRLIVIDNISDLFSKAETSRFQELLHYYVNKGCAVLYISNHHEEVFQICDRVMIMENGQILQVLERQSFIRENIEPFYLSKWQNLERPGDLREKNVLLEFDGVTCERIKNLSFSVYRGECVILQDTDNIVTEEIVDILRGKKSLVGGHICLGYGEYSEKRRKNYLREGIAFIDKNPIESMVYKEQSYYENLSCLLKERKSDLLNGRKIKKSIIKEYISRTGEDIYTKNIMELSEASLYNMLYYRVHLFHPQVVILIQPLSEADMYGRLHILHLIKELTKKHITIIILTVNLSDTLIVANRLITIKKGRVSGEYKSDEFQKFEQDAITPENIW